MPADHMKSELPEGANSAKAHLALTYIDQMLEMEQLEEKERGERLFWDEYRERKKQSSEEEEGEVVENDKEIVLGR